MLAYDTASTIAAAKDLHSRGARTNLLIKIPGTKEGLPAIEEAIFSGVPINVTLLFSREQYLAAAEAYLRGIERRLRAGLRPDVSSVASVFVSRWDAAVADKVPAKLHNQLGIAIAKRIYAAARKLLSSPRWHRIYNLGARPQRLLWASTGTKDPNASDVLYVKALAAPFTVNTMPESTLNALAEHNDLGSILPPDGGDCEETLATFAEAGITQKLWPLSSRTKVRKLSSNPGMICSNVSARRSRRSKTRADGIVNQAVTARTFGGRVIKRRKQRVSRYEVVSEVKPMAYKAGLRQSFP
jgi:transaldolase